MKTAFQRSLVALLIAGSGALAFAQTPNAMDHPPAMSGMAGHGQWTPPDPAKVQARFDKHVAEFKTRLQLNASQEGAWNTFVAAVRPPTTWPARPDRAEIEKLSTPERIDKMHALRVQRDAEMDKREAATKTFYAVLTPSQRKVFDLETLRMHRPHRGWHHEGDHGMGPHG